MSDCVGEEAREPGSARTLEHAWRYFELHAGQRLTSFNFFIVMSGAEAAGMAASIQGRVEFSILGAGLGILLVLTSFVFWKLDQRVSFLIKHAEEYIASSERMLLPEDGRIFSAEPKSFSDHRSNKCFWERAWTYGRCFRVVFFTMGMVGAVGAIVSVMVFMGCISLSTHSTVSEFGSPALVESPAP